MIKIFLLFLSFIACCIPLPVKSDDFALQLQVSSGYRRDEIKQQGNENAFFDDYLTGKSTANIWQSNFTLVMTFYDILFVEGGVGGGYIPSGSTSLSSDSPGFGVLQSYSFRVSGNFTLDTYGALGISIPLYERNNRTMFFQPVIGWRYSQISIENAMRTSISAPYLEARLPMTFCNAVRLTPRGGWVFGGQGRIAPSLYLSSPDSFSTMPMHRTGRESGYTAGIDLSYLIDSHWSVKLGWSYFRYTIPRYDIPITFFDVWNISTAWTSNSILASVEYVVF